MQIQGIPSIQAQYAQKLQSSSPLQNAAPGDKLSAEVTASANGRVTLTLPDGTTLSAGQQASEALLEGDTVELEVQSTDDRGTTLRLMSINGQPLRAEMPVLEYALMRMQMPANNTHVAFARVLNDLGLPLSQETFARMGDIVRQYPDLPPAQAAIFAASDIPLTEENIRAFSEFVKQPLAVTAFAEAVDALLRENPAAARILTTLQSVNGGAHNTSVDQTAHTQTAGQAVTDETHAPLPKQLSADVAQHLNKTGEWRQLMTDAPRYDATQARDALLSFLTSLPRDATAADRRLLLDAFNQARAMPEATEPTAQNRAALTLADMVPPAQEAPLMGDRARTLPLEQVVKSLFALIERGDGDAPEKLKESASALNGRVLALSSAMQQSGSAEARSVQQLGNTLSSQLQMGGELHNLLYAQIPFALSPDDRRTAELYVLKRGNRKTVDDENATIALCLETEHIGRLETLLRVEQNELSLQFRVENEKIQRYVKDQLHGLRSLEFPAQYRFSHAGVVLQKGAITPVNAASTMREAFGLKQTGMLDLTV